MPPRSAVSQLPENIRNELNEKLVKTGFSNYTDLANWLVEQGFEISKSAVHRYGQEFENKLSALKMATEQAKAVAENVEDEEGAMNEALIRLMQQKAFDALIKMEEGGADISFKDLGVLISRVSRASVNQKKFAQEVRAKTVEEIGEKIEKAAIERGMNSDEAQFWRGQVLGVEIKP